MYQEPPRDGLVPIRLTRAVSRCKRSPEVIDIKRALETGPGEDVDLKSPPRMPFTPAGLAAQVAEIADANAE